MLRERGDKRIGLGRFCLFIAPKVNFLVDTGCTGVGGGRDMFVLGESFDID